MVIRSWQHYNPGNGHAIQVHPTLRLSVMIHIYRYLPFSIDNGIVTLVCIFESMVE